MCLHACVPSRHQTAGMGTQIALIFSVVLFLQFGTCSVHGTLIRIFRVSDRETKKYRRKM